jgi:hypothetical protein
MRAPFSAQLNLTGDVKQLDRESRAIANSSTSDSWRTAGTMP